MADDVAWARVKLAANNAWNNIVADLLAGGAAAGAGLRREAVCCATLMPMVAIDAVLQDLPEDHRARVAGQIIEGARVALDSALDRIAAEHGVSRSGGRA